MKTLVLFIVTSLLTVDALAQNGPQLRRIEGQGNDGLVLDFVDGMHDSILNSPNNVYNYPLYDNNKGPVFVDVYNSSITPPGEYVIIFNDTSLNMPGNDYTDYSSKWMIINVPLNDTVFGDTVIGVNYVQDIAAWGMKIRTNPTDNPGTSVYTNNGFLEATMEYADPMLPWLTGLSDVDSVHVQNWIRAGTSTDDANPADNDYAGIDNGQVYEGVLNGTWSPYRLCASSFLISPGVYSSPGAPAWDQYIALNQMKNLASVDVVLTSDQSKWTHCPVIEMQEDASLAIGGAHKMELRKSLSVDKNGRKLGDPGYNAAEGGHIDSAGVLIPAPTGMGWFPGYAVNLETGERLNMAFGEDSWYPADNGADMKWNLTSTVMSGPVPVYGGKHYIYVFGHNADARYSVADTYLPGQLRDVPVYDQGKTVYQLLKATEISGSTGYKREVYTDAMWVNIPLLNPGYSVLATDVKVRLRVSKEYRQQNIDGSNNTNPKYIFDSGSLTGIAPLVQEQRGTIYPNPATDQLYISYPSSQTSASVEIYDMNGQLKRSMVVNLQSRAALNVSDLASGLYLLKIYDGKNSSVQRFIKQ